MKRAVLLFYFSFFIFHFSFSQNPLMKQWDYRFGSTGWDWLTAFQQTKDGGYILGGYSFSGIGGDKTQASKGSIDIWVVKIDSLGNKQWDRDFGGTFQDEIFSLEQTIDGGYILGGTSNSNISGDKTQASQGDYDYWIIKIDSLGNKQWDKDFGGTSEDYLFSLKQTADEGYILGGYSYSGIGGDKTQASQGAHDYWIIKIDSLGNKQWDKNFGGTMDDFLLSLQQTADRGYILGGYSSSSIGGDKTQASMGGYDYWVIKINSLGIRQWDKDFGGTDDDWLFSLQQTTDGGYILGGFSNSGIGGDKTQASKGGSDYWIVKIDSLGIKQWDKDFGGINDEVGFGNISQTKDGGYLLVGSSYSPIGGDKTENNLGSEQTWIVKTDALGSKQWDKTIFTMGKDETGYAIQTKDGCYAIANFTFAGTGGYKTQPSQGGDDYWIIKFCDSTTAASPVANFISSDTAFCNEPTKCINFTDKSTGYPTRWQWFFPDAVPSFTTQQNPAGVCYLVPGTYLVGLIVSNASGSDTLTVSPMITVGGTPPAPVIIRVGDTLFCSYASSYQWYFNGNIIAGSTDSFYVAPQWGTYAVRITDSIGCSRLSDGVTVGVEELGVYGLQFTVYPNPVKETLIISHPSLGKNAVMEIYNVFGEKIYSKTLNSKQETVNCKQLSSGVYFVIVVDKEKRFVGKFVKE